MTYAPGDRVVVKYGSEWAPAIALEQHDVYPRGKQVKVLECAMLSYGHRWVVITKELQDVRPFSRSEKGSPSPKANPRFGGWP